MTWTWGHLTAPEKPGTLSPYFLFYSLSVTYRSFFPQEFVFFFFLRKKCPPQRKQNKTNQKQPPKKHKTTKQHFFPSYRIQGQEASGTMLKYQPSAAHSCLCLKIFRKWISISLKLGISKGWRMGNLSMVEGITERFGWHSNSVNWHSSFYFRNHPKIFLSHLEMTWKPLWATGLNTLQK